MSSLFRMKPIGFVFSFLFSIQSSYADQTIIFSDRDLAQQERASFFNLVKNISSSDEAVGSVSQYRVTQPLSQNLHSVRDAALTTEILLSMYVRYPMGSNERSAIKKMLFEQIQFQQKTVTASLATQLGLGNSYFSLDGQVSNLVSPRVQTEAIALRAISMIKLYNLARVERWSEFQALRKALYDNTINSRGLLKLDLDFLMKIWALPSYDLWGQVSGRHFANLILIKKALVGGSSIASSNGDLPSSKSYLAEVSKIQSELETFWDNSKNLIRSTKSSLSGTSNKSFYFDSSVLFGLVEGQSGYGRWVMSDDRVIANIEQMQEVYRRLYQTNQNASLTPAIGRYPEDNMGQPLVQVSSLMAQYYYDLLSEVIQKGEIKITNLNINFYTRMSLGSNYAIKPGVLVNPKSPLFKYIQQSLFNEGDRYLARLLTFRNSDGSLSEQFSRLTSVMQGPQNSTAATTAFLNAKASRDALLSGGHGFRSVLSRVKK